MKNLLANLCDLAHAAAAELRAHLHGAHPLTDETHQTCAVPGCARSVTGGRLCRYGKTSKYDTEEGGHFAELARWLHDIQAETQRLDPAPSMATRWDHAGGSSLASLRTPAVLDVIVHTDNRSTAHGHLHVGPICRTCPTLEARPCTCPPLDWRRDVHYRGCPRHGIHPSCVAILDDRDERGADRLVVLGVLRDLADRVREERPIIGIPTVHVIDRLPDARDLGPTCPLPCTHESCQGIAWHRDIPEPPTIKRERKLLSRNLDWIADQPWVLAMREQVAELRGQLMKANGNEEDRPLTGYCYKLIDDQGTECHGNLWPAEPAHATGYETSAVADDSPHRPRAVVCDRNPAHRWQKHELAMLSVVLRGQQGRELREPAKPRPAAGSPTGGVGGRLAAVLEQQRRDEPAS